MIFLLKRVFERLAKHDFDLLFYFAIFSLPFENLFFAPSSGWATITPILLFLYAYLNLVYFKEFLKRSQPIILFFMVFCILGTVTAVHFHGRFDDYLAAYVPLVLGFSTLVSILTFYAKNRQDLKPKLNVIVTLLVCSYLAVMLIGLVEFITIKYDLKPFAEFFAGIFKRNYLDKNRVQFFFTEPSFIGMHLFGVLMPLFFITKRFELIILMIMFSFEAIFFGSGVRIILDFLIIGSLASIYYIRRLKKWLLIPIFFASLLIIVTVITTINSRFQKIFFGFLERPVETVNFCDLEENKESEECLKLARRAGVDSDGSFASRIFRIKASMYGYSKSPFGFLTGFGLGNAIYPVRLGHAESKKTYKSTYLKEVNDLANPNYHDDSVSYCLYIRIISEFGVFALLISLIYLVLLAKKSQLDYRYVFLLSILYLYLQFESLAFYAVWLYIATMIVSRDSSSKKVNAEAEE